MFLQLQRRARSQALTDAPLCPLPLSPSPLSWQLLCAIAALCIPAYVESSTARWAAGSSALQSPSSPSYAAWASGTSHAAWSEAYLFNVTNPEELLTGLPPVLVALPPLVISHQAPKRNITWSPRGDSVSYLEGAQRQVLSGDLTARVSTMYMPGLVLLSRQYGMAWGVADALGLPRATPLAQLAAHPGAPALLTTPLDWALVGWTQRLTPPQQGAAAALAAALASGNALLFTTRTARELLFGYPDVIFQALHQLDARFPPNYPGLLYNASSASSTPEGSGAAAADSAPTSFATMATSGAHARELSQWDGSPQLTCCASGPCSAGDRADARPAWGSASANAVHGSASWLQMPPASSAVGGGSGSSSASSSSASSSSASSSGYGALPPAQSHTVFSARLRRSLSLVPTPGQPLPGSAARSEVAERYSILGQGFSLDPRELASARSDASNSAYYSFGPDGLLNVSSCSLARSPIFASLPYFLHGNSSLGPAAGLPPPSPELHDSGFLVEPFSGTLLGGSDRWQSNVFLEPFARMGPFAALSHAYLPLLWVSDNYQVQDAWGQSFAANFLQPRAAASRAAIAGGVFAAVFAVVAFALLSPVSLCPSCCSQGGKGSLDSASSGGSSSGGGSSKGRWGAWGASRGKQLTSSISHASTLLQSLLNGQLGVQQQLQQQHSLQLQLQQPLLPAHQRGSSQRLSSVAELESEEEGSTPRSQCGEEWSCSERSQSRHSSSSGGSSSSSQQLQLQLQQHPSPTSNVLLLGGAAGLVSSPSAGSLESRGSGRLSEQGGQGATPPTLGTLQSAWGPAFSAWD